jgi:pilus assembly protein Flp/PilA
LEELRMNVLLLRLYAKFQELKSSEEGQDLVEYGLVVSMIALAAISSEQSVATVVSQMFTNISSSLA